MQNHPRSRGQRDERRRGQMIFDDREIDAATPQQLGDAPGFPEIAADSGIRNRRDLDAFERLINRRADDQRRARISAVNDQVANAKLDRGGKPRPEMRIAQHDIGNFRLARHHHIRKLKGARRGPPARVLTRKGQLKTIDPSIIAARGEFCLKGRPDKINEQGSCGRVSEGRAQPMVSSADKSKPLTHIGADGEARMVDVSDKAATDRVAIAEGRVRMAAPTLATILAGDAKKGDVIGAARIAGIMAAKKTSDLIPLCHPVSLDQGFGRHCARPRAARPHGAGRGAMRGSDGRRDGGADRRFHRVPHHLRHGESDRPGHEHRVRSG